MIFLKNEQSGVLGTKNIKWNFSKFLVNKSGEVIKRYSPTTKPEDIESDIENLLS
jgi:glutathione peroxidase